MTFVFLLGFTAPGVAVTVTGSPANMAGGAALHASVIGGAFLHPIGNKAIQAEARTRLNFKV
jgi:hypothetical protein